MTLEFTVDHDHTAIGDEGEEQLVGWITFTVQTKPGDFRVRANGVSPKTIKLQPRTAWLADDGHLYKDATSGDPFRLPANDPDFNLDHLTYKATFALTTLIGDPVDVTYCYFPAPSTDTTLYLTKVMTDPEQPVMEVRTKGYAEDILDSTDFGVSLITSPTAAAGRLGLGLADGDVYNWTPGNTRGIARSMAKVLSGGSADHAVFGDSTSSGYVGSMVHEASWPWLLRTQLSLRGVPLGGTGWVLPCHGSGFALDPRWVRVGSWSLQAGYLFSITPGDTLTFTSDMPGPTVKVAALYDSAPYTVSIDGRAAVTVTPPPGPTHGVDIYTVEDLADTVHTVTLTQTSTDPTYFLGGAVLRDVGLQIHNLSRIGQNAYQWPSYTSIPQRGWVVDRLELEPDVVHIALGVNDLNQSRTIDQTITALTAIHDAWPDADVILHAQAAPSPAAAVPTPPSNDTWAAYVDHLYTLADTLDCPLVDWYRMTGSSYGDASAAGLMGDLIHPNAVAEALIAAQVTEALTQKAGI